MGLKLSGKSHRVFLAMAAAASAFLIAAIPAAAQDPRVIVGEEYTPTIWVDPDGCEHWVFDDGFEGFMTPHRNRDGSPVCRRQEICGIILTDILFETAAARVPSSRKDQLKGFFDSLQVFGVLIHGHTDTRGSDEYNMRLSQRRADAVTQVALDTGVRVIESRGFGERRPAQAGTSADALRLNRRVEIICLR